MDTDYEYVFKKMSHALALMTLLFFESRGQCILKCGWNSNIRRWVVCSDCEVCHGEIL